MYPTFAVRSLMLACLAPLAAAAQDAAKDVPAAPAACEARPGAPQWLPCGPDRKLTEAEAKAQFFKDGMVTKLQGTSSRTGKKFFIHLKPGGKLDAGFLNETNVGKSWKFTGGKLCRDYYGRSNVHCAVFDLEGTALYLLDDDGTRSPINSVEIAQP